MSGDIDQTHCAAASPKIDAAVLWLTATTEHDYISRAAFPSIRTATASATRANAASLHFLTLQVASELLADAAHRIGKVEDRLKKAYRAHIENLTHAIAEAKVRPSQFEASAPVCLYRGTYSEEWSGTKEQLRSIGIGLDTPYPGERGGKKRWAQAFDNRGYKVRISRCRIWEWRYYASIDIPYVHPAVRPAIDLDRRIAQAIREQELRSLPSQDGNRLEVEREVQQLLRRLMIPRGAGAAS